MLSFLVAVKKKEKMKKLVIFLIVSLISIFSFAGCAYFQLTNDCNGNSRCVIAKIEAGTLEIHWNKKNDN